MWLRATILPILLLSGPAAAAPEHYRLDTGASSIGFTWYLGRDAVQGQIPPGEAEVTLDFDRPNNSSIAVTLDMRRAKAGFPFATQALQAPNMLDTEEYPFATFRIEQISREGEDIRADGRMTIRGVAKEVTMTARFLRPADQPPGDHSTVIVQLKSSVDRNDFGASGWPEAVGPMIDLDIQTVLHKEP